MCRIDAKNKISTDLDDPVLGKPFELKCDITDFRGSATWTKDSNYPATDCSKRTCSVLKYGRYTFSTNSSGMLMTINPLTADDFGVWKCTTSDYISDTYKLDFENTLYPPESCWITTDMENYYCETSCTHQRDQLSIYWSFDGEGAVMSLNNSDCTAPARKYISPFKKNNSPFNGKGTLLCISGFQDVPNTNTSSYGVWTTLYDCNCKTCVTVVVLHCVFFCIMLNSLLLLIIIRMAVSGNEQDKGIKQNCLQRVLKLRMVGSLYFCMFLVVDILLTAVAFSIIYPLCDIECVCKDREFGLYFGFIFIGFWIKIGVILLFRKKYNNHWGQRKQKFQKEEESGAWQGVEEDKDKDASHSEEYKDLLDKQQQSATKELNTEQSHNKNLENAEEYPPVTAHKLSEENHLTDSYIAVDTKQHINRDNHINDLDNVVFYEEHSGLVGCQTVQIPGTIQPLYNEDTDEFAETKTTQIETAQADTIQDYVDAGNDGGNDSVGDNDSDCASDLHLKIVSDDRKEKEISGSNSNQ